MATPLNTNLKDASALTLIPQENVRDIQENIPGNVQGNIPGTVQETKPERKSDIFGHDYFDSPALGLIPTYNAPAPESYVLGPGDEIVIDVWGATVSHGEAEIGNDGSVLVSDLGPVYLAGMTLRDAESFLKAQLSRIYSGLAEDKGDTFLKLSIGKIKGVVVNVSGEVESPGAYTIPSLSSVPSAIFMAGGIKENASVRNINIFRKGRKIANFDLYEFILKGRAYENLRLQEGDIINVPAYTSTAQITGAVIRAQRYEIKEGESVRNLIDFALGFRTNARKDEVNLTRFESTDGVSFDIKAEQFAGFHLKDGDVVNVRSYRTLYSNRVSISGPVKYPGTYAIDGSISDVAGLIRMAGGLIEDAYTGRGQIERIGTDFRPEFVTFNLKDVLDGKETISLMREDKVTLFNSRDFIQDMTVTINGHVKEPDTFPFYEGMTVADVILRAGGVLEDVYGNRGQISRTNRDGIPVMIPFNVNDALNGTGNVPLMRSDTIRIYGIRELREDADISVDGEVRKPGTFTYYEGATLADALMLAGGLTNGADLTKVEISSRGGRERGTVKVYDLEDNPDLSGTLLKPYDIVSIRRLTYYRKQAVITINGEVISPGPYTVDKAEVRLSDIINKCGGFTDEAYIHGTSLRRYLTEEETARVKLAFEIAKQNAKNNDAIDSTSTLVFDDSFLIGIDLEDALKNPGSEEDVVLRDGDVIEVPQMNNTVKIFGGVFYPSTVSFQKNLGWKGYIRLAGGFKNLARRGKVYALYMNGKAVERSKIVPEPGMELVVPERNQNSVKTMTAPEIISIATSTTSLAAMIMTLTKQF